MKTLIANEIRKCKSCIRDAILKPLKLVIDGAAHILMCIPHDAHHELRCLSFCKPQSESITKAFDGRFAFKAGEPCSQHEADALDQLLCVRSYSEEGFDSKVDE